MVWLVVHITFLTGFKNRFTALFHWIVSFLGRSRSERTITMQQIFARRALEELAEAERAARRSRSGRSSGAGAPQLLVTADVRVGDAMARSRVRVRRAGSDHAVTRRPAVASRLRSEAARTVVATDRLRDFRGCRLRVCSRHSRRRWTLHPRSGRTLLAVAGRWVVEGWQRSGGRGRLRLRAAGARRAARTYVVENPDTDILSAAVDRHGAVAWLEGPFPYAVAGSDLQDQAKRRSRPTTEAAG